MEYVTILSIAALIIISYCFYFIVDYGSLKSKQMICYRLLFILSLAAIAIEGFSLYPARAAFLRLVAFFLIGCASAYFIHLILVIIAWIAGCEEEKLAGFLAGKKKNAKL